MKLGASLQSLNPENLLQEVERAIELGFNTLQVFICQKGIMPSIEECFKDGERIKYLVNKHDLDVFIHAPLMISPVHETEGKRKIAAYSISKHMRVAYHLGFKGVVVHPGSSKGDWKSLLENTLDIVFAKDKFYGEVKLLLENASGQGNMIGSIENLDNFINNYTKHKVFMCIDTAHAWGFGVDVLNERFCSTLKNLENCIGLIHLNNPDYGVTKGSRKDRHRAGFDTGEFTREQFFTLTDYCKRFPCVMEAFYIDELPIVLELQNFIAMKGE